MIGGTARVQDATARLCERRDRIVKTKGDPMEQFPDVAALSLGQRRGQFRAHPGIVLDQSGVGDQ